MMTRVLGRFLPVLFLALACSAAAAQPSRLSGFGLLRLEPSARAAALAGSYGALASDVNALYYNPALLGDEADRQIAVSYLNHVADIHAGFVSYARQVDRLGGTVGAAVRYLSYGEFERTDVVPGAEGEGLGTFGASEAAVTLSYARPLAARVRGGVNLHAIFASIDDASAQALAADVGVAYVIPEQQLALAASLHHVGFVTASLGREDDRLPVDLRLTVTKRLRYVPLALSVTGYDLTEFENENGTALNEAFRHLALSGEFLFGPAFRVRVGYNHRRHEDLKATERLDLAGVGLGFGLHLRRFGFDYAYNSWSAFGGLHYFTLRTQI